MANTRILNAAVVAALFAACTDVPCETKGAVRDHRDVCGCPDGTREVERVVNDDSKSECVSGDAGGVAIDNASETDASRARPAAADGGREMDAAILVDAANAKEAGEETEAAVLTAADAGDVLTLADAGSPEPPLVPAVPACIPAAEDCDGKDNDCDGKVDQGVKTRCWADSDGDGYAATAAALVESCDACGAKQTAQEPVAGKADCDDADTKKSPGATDICGDKVDNDCDGKPDDDDNNACGGACSVQLPGKPGDACNNGQQGACARPGTYECRADHSMVCNAPMVPAAAAEVCGNGKDDDCKNGVDDGCVKNLCGGWSPLANALGAACTVTVGTCSYAGAYKCATDATDATVCVGQPPAEVCDSKDNDCNGQVDDRLGHEVGEKCLNGQLGTCKREGKYVCSKDLLIVCDAPMIEVTKQRLWSEICDGNDNDCDGAVDEVNDATDKWWHDCDGDGYASCSELTKFIRSCTKPAPDGCGWTPTDPGWGYDPDDTANWTSPVYDPQCR